MGIHRSSTVPGQASLAWVSLGALVLLAGCPTVDLGDTPSDIGLCNPAKGIEFFETRIWPEFIRPTDAAKGCTKAGNCHNEAGGNAMNFRNPPDFPFNYRQTQIYLNCGQPMMSELLTRPLRGVDAHGGGDLWDPGEPGVMTFLEWFQE